MKTSALRCIAWALLVCPFIFAQVVEAAPLKPKDVNEQATLGPDNRPDINIDKLAPKAVGPAKFAADRVLVQYTVSENRPADKPRNGIEKVLPGETVEQAIARVSARDDVEYATPDFLRQKAANPPEFDAKIYNAWHQANIDAPGAWAYAQQQDVTVCVIDTGVNYMHPDLEANMHPTYKPGCDATECPDCNTCTTPGTDVDGHGSHCAGIIGAVSGNGVGVAGIAANNNRVKLVGCRFLGPDGGYDSDAIKCINWCVFTVKAQILSNSYGGGGANQLMVDTIKLAGEQGAVFVAAAGNEAANLDTTVTYPVSYNLPNMIGVLATARGTDGREGMASYSNYGIARGSVHVGAPGSAIISTTLGSNYESFSGTSMATPLVAGTLALMKSVVGDKLTMMQLRQIVIDTSDVLLSLAGRTAGNGRRINAYRAVRTAVDIANANGAGISVPSAPLLTSATNIGDLTISALTTTLTLAYDKTKKYTFTSRYADASGTMATVMKDGNWAKNTYRLNISPQIQHGRAFTVNTCRFPSTAWDTQLVVLKCKPSTANKGEVEWCESINADDGCSSGYGSSVSIAYEPGRTYYAVVSTYSATGAAYNYYLATSAVASATATLALRQNWAPPALPSTGIEQNIGTGFTTSFVSTMAASCPAIVSSKLTNTAHYKHIWKITPPTTPMTSYTLDTCDYVGAGLDTMIAVFACTEASSTATSASVRNCQCYAADDGCPNGGYGTRLANIVKDSTKKYYAVVFPYQSTVKSGSYKLRIS